MTAPVPDFGGSTEDGRTTAQSIVASLGLPDLSDAPSEPLRPLPLIGLHRLSRDTTVLYSVGSVDASGRVKSIDIVRAMGWRPGDKLEIVTALGGIVIIASPDGLFSVPHQPCIVIPAAARHQHDIGPGDHVLLAAAPEYGLVVIHTRQAMNEMLARYHSTFGSPDRQAHE
jgi:bifunctional DNA-binding transcriptional regulator/antitoxin component of YhaV-PrlF toxin-antitoxin module